MGHAGRGDGAVLDRRGKSLGFAELLIGKLELQGVALMSDCSVGH
jgi:hypothetical protein